MALTLVTPPAAATGVISLAQVRLQTKTEGVTADDALLTGVIIPAAVGRCERATGRQLLDATWELGLEDWPCGQWIEIPKPPLVSIVSVKYVDTAGVLQTLATDQYDVDAPVGPSCWRGRIAAAYGVTWPSVRCGLNAVRVRFRAGYVDQSGEMPAGPVRTIPADLVNAMLLDAGALYRHRESILSGKDAAAIELPSGSSSIYRGFRSRATQRID
jgi:uncharacterized phiE125 gp8 family phage protein